MAQKAIERWGSPAADLIICRPEIAASGAGLKTEASFATETSLG